MFSVIFFIIIDMSNLVTPSITEVSAGHELNQIFAKPKFTILTKCWLRYLVLYFICWDQHTINYVCLNFTTQKTGTQYQLLFPLRQVATKNSEFWFCKNLVEFMSIISIFKTSVSQSERAAGLEVRAQRLIRMMPW